ncbi:putative alpha,alpha-trehalose-phosphate synthase subunit Tps2 [Aspergillus clavatus NRRL 1]|uniref:Alpha,alpha-trehalose-phosphate synthase subunit TPS2, putative n=1 Tax=Aspergillus clavatus (strain ATCC 1007 / CBS 513.65 / DSM 816 / NCTC 3887 / NRRL 1 / QM 1276 / 107) TaxID=344612 RepID=A1CJ39_ASPCL|nr:alpha,alpha-trehalose-phosphate synthase subunit TPS2, putative [Aspergillus clavatus NRRL 1]EAW09163.1 alpha,alpha-trehalose-phosphate synthase subunit TPS2, putative [Aspergillus clavatus NRRL 1]
MSASQDSPSAKVLDGQPNPVIVGPGMKSLGEDAYTQAANVTPSLDTDKKHPVDSDAPSYFANIPDTQPSADVNSPATPADAAKSAKSPIELLHRLSLNRTPLVPDFDPREQYPGLNLTGRFISAAFCIPYKVYYRPGSDWELKPRPGTSALFDSFAYLGSEETKWSHTLVGWTGEVEPIQETPASLQQIPVNAGAKLPPALNGVAVPLSKAAAPVPVDSSQRPPSHPLLEGFTVPQEDRARLDGQLGSGRYGKIAPVWLSDESEEPEESSTIFLEDQGKWRRYAEKELYPLLHYKQHGPTDGRSERKWWGDYVRMNRLFADRILEEYKEGDIVWIHDYHLFLLPSLLRQRIPNIYIGFFLHAPFPSSEFMRCLAKRKEVLTGVLGSNMIGFQTFSYSRHFSSCCTRVLGFESNSAGVDAYGAHVAVDVFPIGIDVKAIQKAAFGPANIENAVVALRNLYAGKKIIVGRDRLDSVRGVAQKLQAFEAFLERYPEWRDKVVLIQVTSPTSVEEEKEDPENKIASQISNLVSTINGRFGSISFSPVKYYPQYLSQHEYFALLRVADVGLITTVRDGMNTTSLEYILCQQNTHSPLILSEFSGTAGPLSSAIHINPWDTIGVAEAINEALTMSPEEKRLQHVHLYKHVTTNTVLTWSNQFVTRLLTNLSSFDQSVATPALDRATVLKQYRKARKRLFMFDYDGTLTPIVKDPQAAIPSDRVLRNIKTLAADPRNAVWIISGRDQAFLDEWMGHIPELGLSAEHGCFIRKPRSDDWENLAESSDMGWQKEVVEVFQHFTERTQGSFIERKRVALTWHYRRADPEYGAFQARECRKQLEETVAKRWDVEVMAGKANLEVRPTFVNKGFIASRLVDEYGTGPGQAPEFVLCLGDDFTDEDMFRALKKANLPADHVYSVTVGASSKQTEASWHLLEPADVIGTISVLNNSSSAQEY